MFERSLFRSLAAPVTLILFAATVQAVTIDVVPVGNPGNSGELAGKGAAGYGPNRISGAVNYTYNIGSYEVTAGQYTEFLNAVGGVDTYGLYNTSMWSSLFGCRIERYDGSGTVADPYRYRVAVDRAKRPVNYVSWGDAARFCNWLHNGQPAGAQDNSTTEDGAYFLNGATSDAAMLAVSREADWIWAIPTEDEWYKAAYHKNDGATSNYFNYPTSNDSAPDRDMAEVVNPGNNANYNLIGRPFPIDAPYYTTIAGEFELSGSPYGTFDQGGNVSEWIEGVMSGSYRGVRGGAYNGVNLSLRASDRYSHGLPTNEVSHIGFRVASIIGPDFLRGDSNVDSTVDVADVLTTLAYIFLGEEAPGCLDAADSNDDGSIDLSDAVYTLLWRFVGGAEPPAPGPEECGADPTNDELDCESFAHCP